LVGERNGWQAGAAVREQQRRVDGEAWLLSIDYCYTLLHLFSQLVLISSIFLLPSPIFAAFVYIELDIFIHDSLLLSSSLILFMYGREQVT